MDAIGIIGVLVGVFLLAYLIYKGLDPVITGFLVSSLVIVTNGLSFQSTWDSAMSTVGEMAAIYGPLFIFGSIMGIMYSSTGAAVSMMQLFMKPFQNAKSAAVKRMGSLCMFMLLRVVIGFAGLDSFVDLPIPPAFAFLVLAIILVGAAADSSLVLLAAVAVDVYIPGGLSVMSCGVIIIMASCVLDSLPNNLGLIMQCKLSGVTVREAYAPIFHTTVVLTFGLSIIGALCAMLGLCG